MVTQKLQKNQIPFLKNIYKLVIISAFLSFVWSSYSISQYAMLLFKLSFYAFICITTLRIGSKSFFKSEIILPHTKKETNIPKEKPTEEITKKASWLQEKMRIHLFYLNSELTLKSLAEKLNMHPNILSKVINDGLHKKFSDFINEYRINSFIEKLHSVDYKHITLLSLAFECGFNSKTTFNRVFKNIMGITPLQYKKSIKNNYKSTQISPVL